MLVEFIVYAVRDGKGNVATGVVDEGSDGVQVSGMIGQDGGPLYFESEFYHLPTWCREFGLTFWSQKRQIEIPSEPVQAGE